MSSRFHLTSLSVLILSGLCAVGWISRSVGKPDEPKPPKLKNEKPPLSPEEELRKELEKALKKEQKELEKLLKDQKPPPSPEEQWRKEAEKARKQEEKDREKLLKEMRNEQRRPEEPRAVQPQAQPPVDVPAWFVQIDRNHDGQVALYEWLDANGVLNDYIRMDLNRDGLLTRHELQSFIASLTHTHDHTGVPEYVRIDHETTFVVEGRDFPLAASTRSGKESKKGK